MMPLGFSESRLISRCLKTERDVSRTGKDPGKDPLTFKSDYMQRQKNYGFSENIGLPESQVSTESFLLQLSSLLHWVFDFFSPHRFHVARSSVLKVRLPFFWSDITQHLGLEAPGAQTQEHCRNILRAVHLYASVSPSVEPWPTMSIGAFSIDQNYSQFKIQN